MQADIGPALVPELLVIDLDRSIAFWSGLCGFAIRYSRPEERFAYLVLRSAQVMLQEAGTSRNWITGPLEAPLGRGINLQITIPDCGPLSASLVAAGVALFMEPETKRYRVGPGEIVVWQFLVADPDGYLLRFQSPCDATL